MAFLFQKLQIFLLYIAVKIRNFPKKLFGAEKFFGKILKFIFVLF